MTAWLNAVLFPCSGFKIYMVKSGRKIKTEIIFFQLEICNRVTDLDTKFDGQNAYRNEPCVIYRLCKKLEKITDL